MKTLSLYITLFIIFLFSTAASACEICGNANSNFQIGMMPTFSKGFIGLRYGYTAFNSHMHEDMMSEFSHDRYQTTELWGGYNFNRFQVITFLPYVMSKKTTNEGITRFSGVGDLMVLVNYRLSPSAKAEPSLTRHTFMVGAGIKLPTGENQLDVNHDEFNIGDFNAQAGTGSTDFLLNAMYQTSWQKNGVVANLAYRLNTKNAQDYHFGNRTYATVMYYRTLGKKKVMWRPNVGLNYQHNENNRFEDEWVEHSKGFEVNATLGLNVLAGQFGISLSGFEPLKQEYSDGHTMLDHRLSAGITYSLR